MELAFSSIEEFTGIYSSMDEYAVDKCPCGGIRELELIPATIHIGNHTINIVDCPVLTCPKCGSQKLGNRIPQELSTQYHFMQERGYSGCKLTSKSLRLKYAAAAGFKYDSRDLNIPGLSFDDDPSHTIGFSCPVFFDRKVLNNFFTDDDYELDIFSESFGSISKKGHDGWIYDWQIDFGVNRNNLVVMFLGDLDQIEPDDRAIHWLRAYNVDSDHILIDTEFYRAQLLSEFSDPIIEQRILALRNDFYGKIQCKYGISLFHLEQEVETKGKTLRKPINYSESEIKENIIVLDGLLNEGIDCDALRTLYRQLVTPLPKNLDNLRSRKLLQGIIASKTNEAQAKSIISPLFYLNDLRVCFAHLISQDEVDKYKENIVKAFSLVSFSEYRKLYDALMDALYQLYKFLYVTEF